MQAGWDGRRGGQGAAGAFFPLLLAPSAWGVGGSLRRTRSRRLGGEKGGREHAVTIRTGRAWSLSLRRSAFLLSQCFLTHFLSSQSDIYLTLQLRCAGNAKFGGCKHSPCCRVYTWGLCTHARAGTSSPRAHANACAQGHSSLPAHGRAPVAAGHRCLPAFEHPSRSVRAQAVPCQTRRACRRQICPCQARTAQETDLRACSVRLDPKPCVPVRCTVHGNDHRLAARVFIQARSRRCTD